ncbi:MAG TPA: magnesium transporter CorA family protein [Myxococcaceae bacterium]|nr:magnesium transporter CorA family protein [Myxococcaceae bacterium]
MITFHLPSGEAAVPEDLAACPTLAQRATWIDLLRPTREEELAVEKALAAEVPTREEMQQLELSRRLYVESGALFMTATVLTGADSSRPESSGITFILARDRLVTVRYTEPRAFQAFVAHRRAHLADHATPLTILEGLVDAIVERLADVLEATGAMVENLSLDVFPDRDGASGSSGIPRAQRDYNAILGKIGRASDLVARSRESLVSLGRLVAFFREARKDDPAARATVEHFATVSGDFAALSDYATFLSGKASFLLDATLGMISNEQNAIIKLVSVAALVFGPPTLIASIYGMNFEHMPELHWTYAYPLAVLTMVLSAIFPYAYFKRRGWL